MEQLGLEAALRDVLMHEYWDTQDPEVKALGELLDKALAIIDRLAAGDYSGTSTNQ